MVVLVLFSWSLWLALAKCNRTFPLICYKRRKKEKYPEIRGPETILGRRKTPAYVHRVLATLQRVWRTSDGYPLVGCGHVKNDAKNTNMLRSNE